MNKSTFVTVNCNTLEHITACVESVHKFYPSHQMVVFDNNSTDGSRTYLSKKSQEWPHLRVMESDKNIFHGPALHRGISAINTDYFFTIDSDAYILKAGVLEAMEELLIKNKAYAVGHLMWVDKFGFNVSADAPGAKPYVHPYAALWDRRIYNQLKEFLHHGAPCLDNLVDAASQGYVLLNFEMKDFIFHHWRGTVKKEGYHLDFRGYKEAIQRKIQHLFK